MSPTLHDGDVVLVRFGAVVRAGDVVLVRWTHRPGQLSVKRASRPAEHSGTAAGGARGAGGVGGHLWWVLGDNPFGSTDSRTLGPAEVLAVARWRLWPAPRRLAGRDR